MSYVGWIGKKAKHNAVIAQLLVKQGVSARRKGRGRWSRYSEA